jgi:hypothetical protein
MPSPGREGISLGKQHLSSQNGELLSGLCQGRLVMHGHFSDGRDEKGYGVKAVKRSKRQTVLIAD